MSSVSLSIGGMSCGHCVSSVRRALESVPGAQVEDVRIGSARVVLPGDASDASRQALIDALNDAGYEAVPSSDGASHGHPEGR